ncbi:Probable translation initiation factor eIF-2B subunit epsilon [Geodia barretti]|uniref:Probable translation initiation factor eIF-2B subunit epsilon n=1 Tax=Geodia barretti TaxID=519541 RepID=A0AA35RDF8_GEOBA|nr:Probable translation initiation factor eIF-2B subunit epsilon [Geodia barretti]
MSSDRVEAAEDAIQAVVIADSFNYRFLPVTIEQPRALLPLVNRPLIDYTVEFLAVAGVQEIFVYCCTRAEAVRAHLERLTG